MPISHYWKLKICTYRFYHVTYAFQSESTLYSCLNTTEFIAQFLKVLKRVILSCFTGNITLLRRTICVVELFICFCGLNIRNLSKILVLKCPWNWTWHDQPIAFLTFLVTFIQVTLIGPPTKMFINHVLLPLVI